MKHIKIKLVKYQIISTAPMNSQAMQNHLTSGSAVNHSFDISYEENQRQQQEFQNSMTYPAHEAVNMSTANVMLDSYSYNNSYDHHYPSSLPASYGANYDMHTPMDTSGFAEDYEAYDQNGYSKQPLGS